MAVLSDLKPERVFFYFEKISEIPRGSGDEWKISNYLKGWAAEKGIECIQDRIGNIIFKAPATPGYENAETVILQGHMDMVCEKVPESTHDFKKDGLELFIDGDKIGAKGTTLGGDDGVAVAFIMAILDSDVPHPALECVITISEETGMDGAIGIDLSGLKGKKLINLDSEKEGVITAGCAGGSDSFIKLPVQFHSVNAVRFDLRVHGLMGGHSGEEIDKGRANASYVIGRLFEALKRAGVLEGIISASGGTKHNVITPEAIGAVAVLDENADKAEAVLKEEFEDIKKAYGEFDPDMQLDIKRGEKAEQKVLVPVSEKAVLLLLNVLPQGVQSMMPSIKGLVQTSLNLGVMVLNDEILSLEISVRSALARDRDYLIEKLRLMAEFVGAEFVPDGAYPPWEFVTDSKLQATASAVFERMYGKKPVINTIHAGLECGLLGEKIPGLDAISIGPDMDDIHSPKERLHIESTKRVYEYLLNILAEK
ncbi:MAG: aminoacyl-histidine dipeptidase [Lachnospiraceae bacterium]|nr:aminoacyl-histidine dipeptidase [Lachnospiraceae bacterium]